MTQTTDETQWTVANLTASIRRTTGAQRDTYARDLLAYAPIDLVAVLVAASTRHQASESATAAAEDDLTRITNVVRIMIGVGDSRTERAIDEVRRSASTYVYAMHRGLTDELSRSQRLFVDAVAAVTAMMTTDEDRAEVPALACAAMALPMAEMTERATKTAYQSIQRAIQSQLR